MSRSAITPVLKAAIRHEANYRCGYCFAEEVLMGVSLAIDHIIPLAAGGTNGPDNLWAACRQCNELKNHVPMPKIRRVARSYHFSTRVCNVGPNILNGTPIPTSFLASQLLGALQ